MYEGFTERTKKVMALANQEAQRLNHEYIGTEHVLLALIREGTGVGATVLKDSGLDLEKVRIEVGKLVKSGPDMVAMGNLPQTPRTKEVIENAISYARKRNENFVGTEHILYGLLQNKENISYKVLQNSGLEKEQIIEELEKLLSVDKDPVLKDSLEKNVENDSGYWKVPKTKMDFSSLLRNIHGFSIVAETLADPTYDLIMGFKNQIIGKLPLRIEGIHAHERIVYDKENQEQVKSALELRDIFDLNNIKYEEEPPLTEVLEYLKKPAGDSELIKKIEEKIN